MKQKGEVNVQSIRSELTHAQEVSLYHTPLTAEEIEEIKRILKELKQEQKKMTQKARKRSHCSP